MPGVDGIVSCLDTSSMIGAIVGAAVPKTVMESQLAEMKKKRNRLRRCPPNLRTFKAIEEIDTKEKFEATSLTQLDDTQFTANIEEGVCPNHDIRHFTAANEVEVSLYDKETTAPYARAPTPSRTDRRQPRSQRFVEFLIGKVR